MLLQGLGIRPYDELCVTDLDSFHEFRGEIGESRKPFASSAGQTSGTCRLKASKHPSEVDSQYLKSSGIPNQVKVSAYLPPSHCIEKNLDQYADAKIVSAFFTSGSARHRETKDRTAACV